MTNRQENILGAVVREYVDSAVPVGSSLIADKYGFDLSSATLRSEMMVLEKEGYLYQPYTSAGRVPTDKGFRFFVDRIMRQRELGVKDQKALQLEVLKLRAQNKMLARTAAKLIASMSDNLVISGLVESEDVYRSGFQKLVSKPEFKNLDSFCKLAEVLDYLDENFIDIIDGVDRSSEIKVLIGKENPLDFADECSMIVSKYSFQDGEEGFLAILGPKRMKYSRNISIVDYFKKLLGGNMVLVVFLINYSFIN